MSATARTPGGSLLGARANREWSLFLIVSFAPLPAYTQGEAYYFATGGIAGGPHSFADRWCGPDLLPYTADDFDLPERGNLGGTWGFSWIDADGDGELDEEEHIFTLIRRGDDFGGDDAHTFSTRSYPQYGVLAESENWSDYHQARNRGPSRSQPGDLLAEGNDFEHNDRPGEPYTGWADASNYYWYNNARADQRGPGSRYYFEHRNGAGLDEIEGFSKYLSFQNNLDDPATPGLNEHGACRDRYMRSTEAVTRGLLIPVAAIAGLDDGELSPLFGWYAGDMAAYVRDVLGPKLDDPQLTVFFSDSACAQSGLPATHLMLLQAECPIKINASGDCPDVAVAEALAAYWGVHPITPGQPATRAVYRTSHILLLNDSVTPTELGVPSWVTDPQDGIPRNLWVQDDFWRANPAEVGRYVTGGAWSITDDSSLDRGCAETDQFFFLPAGGPGFFEAPLGTSLEPTAGALYGIVELGLVGLPAAAGAGGGRAETYHQIIFLGKGAVLAYAQFDLQGSTVNIGGTLDANGLAIDPVETRAGLSADIPLFDPLASEFTRFVFRVGPAGIGLLTSVWGEYRPNDYLELDSYAVLAALDQGIAGSVDAVRFATSGAGEAAIAADGFAVFANLDPDLPAGGLQKPGDENQDGALNISDPVALLNHLFAGTNPALPCGDGTIGDPANLALLDANGDQAINITDPVATLNFLFAGGPAPEACGNLAGCPCRLIAGCPQLAPGACTP